MSAGDSNRTSSAGEPSAFFTANASRLLETAPLGPVLDLACGRGRHALAVAAMGLAVTAIDVNADALVELASNRGQMPHDRTGPIKTLREDLEEPPLPVLEGGHFGAVLVFNYLHRPLFPWIASLVAPGGLVLYETFTVAQKALGWGPKRDAFLLRAGELPTLLPDFVAEFYAEGPSQDARAPHTARLLARRPV